MKKAIKKLHFMLVLNLNEKMSKKVLTYHVDLWYKYLVSITQTNI